VDPATAPKLLLDEVDREYLRALVSKEGLNAAARMLGMSRGVVSSAVGGIEVRRGSIEMLREAIATSRRANGGK
jgi:hypothetical protein